MGFYSGPEKEKPRQHRVYPNKEGCDPHSGVRVCVCTCVCMHVCVVTVVGGKMGNFNPNHGRNAAFRLVAGLQLDITE